MVTIFVAALDLRLMYFFIYFFFISLLHKDLPYWCGFTVTNKINFAVPVQEQGIRTNNVILRHSGFCM